MSLKESAILRKHSAASGLLALSCPLLLPARTLSFLCPVPVSASCSLGWAVASARATMSLAVGPTTSASFHGWASAVHGTPRATPSNAAQLQQRTCSSIMLLRSACWRKAAARRPRWTALFCGRWAPAMCRASIRQARSGTQRWRRETFLCVRGMATRP